MFTMNTVLWFYHRMSHHQVGTSTDKQTRWIRLRDGLNTSRSYIRRFCVEGTSCPSRTECLDETIIMHNEKMRRVRLFRDDNPDSAFSPQYVDADILRMTFKRQINFGLSNPEILDLKVLKERRQDRL